MRRYRGHYDVSVMVLQCVKYIARDRNFLARIYMKLKMMLTAEAIHIWTFFILIQNASTLYHLYVIKNLKTISYVT